jgi:hypothetical protein
VKESEVGNVTSELKGLEIKEPTAFSIRRRRGKVSTE